MPHFLTTINNSKLNVGGVEVTITQMTQSLTYVSLIESVPSLEDNLEIIEKASRRLPNFSGIQENFVVKPQMVPVPAHILMPYDRAKETLPKIICMAKVNHPKVFRDWDQYYSELGILWFPDDLAMPIAEDVLKKMEEIPFKEICGEYGYFL